MTHDVFISYSSVDKQAADTVCSILEQNSISCWIAPRDITPGLDFAEAIIDGIKSSRLFVLVYSSNSSNSKQVIREVDRAVHNGLSIINLRLEDAPLSKQLEYYISSVHWLDALDPPLEQHMQKLCSVVQMFLKPEDIKEAEIAEALRKGIIKQNEPAGTGKGSRVARRRTILVSGILLAVVIAIATLVVYNIGGRGDIIKPGMIQSLVVLPFDNYTGDEQFDYVASGMHASLIGDIGKVSALRVIGETSSNVYKETDKSAPDIAKELNVDLVLEPTLTCYGDTVCILVRAIAHFPEEKQIWVAEYSEDKSKILSLWNRITKQIAEQVKVELTPEEDRLLAKSIIVDREAYEDYLKSSLYEGDLSPESLLKARDYLKSAIEKDPGWAPLYSAMATVWVSIATMGPESPETAIPKTYENLNKALELDPDLAEAHYMSAFLAFSTEWNWEKSENEFLKTLAINPNYTFARMHYSYILYFLQRPEEGLAQAKLAYKLDPLNPIVQVSYAHILCCEGDCDSALTVLENILIVDPENYYAWDAIRIAAARCGDFNRVFEAEKHYMALEQETWEEIEKIYNEKGFYEAYNEIVRQMEVYGQDHYILPIDMALRYYILKNDDKAMDWLEKGFELHDPNLPFCAFSLMGFKRLYDNPRLIEIAEKMNLPVPAID